MLDATQDAIHKYEEWLVELGQRRVALASSRTQLRWLLVVCAAATAVAFHWGVFAALCMAFFWLSLFGVGLYIASMYDWDYIRQIDATRSELERLRAGTSEAVPHEDGAIPLPLPDSFQERRISRKLTWGFRDRT